LKYYIAAKQVMNIKFLQLLFYQSNFYRDQKWVSGTRYELDSIHNMRISMTCVLTILSHCVLHTCMRCMVKLEMCRACRLCFCQSVTRSNSFDWQNVQEKDSSVITAHQSTKWLTLALGILKWNHHCLQTEDDRPITKYDR
jgi:hypothetical protein